MKIDREQESTASRGIALVETKFTRLDAILDASFVRDTRKGGTSVEELNRKRESRHLQSRRLIVVGTSYTGPRYKRGQVPYVRSRGSPLYIYTHSSLFPPVSLA